MGAAAGLLAGSSVGAGNAQAIGVNAQARYDAAYTQCMYAHGNAIHGLTRWMPWAAVRHGAEAVLLRTPVLGRAGYPFCLEMDAEYQLSEEHGLRVTRAGVEDVAR